MKIFLETFKAKGISFLLMLSFICSVIFMPETLQAKSVPISYLITAGQSQMVRFNGEKGEKSVRVELLSEEDTVNLNSWKKPTYHNTLYIYIDDSKVYECKIDTSDNPAIGEVYVTNMDKTKKAKDIFVAISEYEYAGDLLVIDYCTYESGSIVKRQDLKSYLDSELTDLAKSNEWGPYHTVYGLQNLLFTRGDNKLNVSICGMSNQLGYFHGTYTLKYKNKKFAGSSTIQGEINEITTPGELQVAKTFYTKANGTTKAFSAKKGDTVEVLKYKYVNHSLYIQVENSKGKTGWIKDSDESVFSTWGYGTLHA
ncbi:MAG: hypothetical protein NC180_02360 [Muribaculaceae bacterium]|nr:hypothetical protein [Roseburia sp.]MCM1431582.1 hypothetical protein [Muribaculaceae bacterium]MCM1492047.1 hypothetical protein [Muribaculaceae bacterium]